MTTAPALIECLPTGLALHSGDVVPLVDESPLITVQYVDRYVHHATVLIVRYPDNHYHRLAVGQFQEVGLLR